MTIKNRTILMSLLASVLALGNVNQRAEAASWMGIAAVAGVGLASYVGHRILRRPTRPRLNPTLNDMYTVTIVPTGQVCSQAENNIQSLMHEIKLNKGSLSPTKLAAWGRLADIQSGVDAPEGDTLFFASWGYGGQIISGLRKYRGAGTGIHNVARYMRDSLINGPTVTFNYDDCTGCFNFAGTAEKAGLNCVYNEMCKKNPSKKIVAMGMCRGASMLLQLDNPQNIAALVLESPVPSLEHIIKHRAQDFHVPTGLIRGIFKCFLSSYNRQQPTLFDALRGCTLPKALPILIGHLKDNDVNMTNAEMKEIIEAFKDAGYTNLYVSVIEDEAGQLEHARLSRSIRYQQQVNAFLQEHGLPCNHELAAEGMSDLGQMRDVANNPDVYL